ncbi:MAG: hypothetical protein ACE14V_04635 [bacterium]
MRKGVFITLIVIILGITFYLGYHHAKTVKENRIRNSLNIKSLSVTYETCPIVTSRLSQAISRKALVSKSDIESMFGKPESIDTNDTKFDNWHYRITDIQYPQVYDITITFDKSGNIANLLMQHSLINPAVLTLSVSESTWKGKVKPQYLQENNKKYIIYLESHIDNIGLISCEPVEDSIIPEKQYRREAYPGQYDIYLVIAEKDSRHTIEKLLMQGKVQLAPNETKQFQF